MSLLKDSFWPVAGPDPGMARFDDCESLVTYATTKKMIAEEYLVRHSLSIQQALDEGEFDNVDWAPGTKNPADGLTQARSDAAPSLRLLVQLRAVTAIKRSGLERMTGPWGAREFLLRAHTGWLHVLMDPRDARMDWAQNRAR